MSEEVILARLVLINDHLIELLKWAIENDKPDFAVNWYQIPKAFASILDEMGASNSKSLTSRKEDSRQEKSHLSEMKG